MRTFVTSTTKALFITLVGMKPLSERDENKSLIKLILICLIIVGMKPLSERDENEEFLCFL